MSRQLETPENKPDTEYLSLSKSFRINNLALLVTSRDYFKLQPRELYYHSDMFELGLIDHKLTPRSHSCAVFFNIM